MVFLTSLHPNSRVPLQANHGCLRRLGGGESSSGSSPLRHFLTRSSKIDIAELGRDLTTQGVLVQDGFNTPLLTDMRKHFEHRFENPLETTSDRFVWDYWHVPGQYSLMRTPADAFFPPDIYGNLEEAILSFGKTLGFKSCSPIWLSYYVDGHRQEFHTDSNHGPLAFVLSLSPKNRKFTGGETLVLKDDILNFWHSHQSGPIEMKSIFEIIDPCFDRMVVFDPRIPHGVRVVEGAVSPLDARVVVHGWYTESNAYFEGSVEEETATDILNAGLEPLYQELGDDLPMARGVLHTRIDVNNSDGSVERIEILVNTLQFAEPIENRYDAIDAITDRIEYHVGSLNFSAAIQPDTEGTSHITLPFIFE